MNNSFYTINKKGKIKINSSYIPVLGVLGVFVLTLVFSSRNLFTANQLRPDSANASTQVVFVDANNQPITESTSATVRVKLTSPFSQTTVGSNPNVRVLGAVISNWDAQYFNNRYLNGNPVLLRTDADINFNWGSGSPSNIIPRDFFSARWTKTQYFNPGTYRVTVSNDDGMRVYLDSNLIYNNWRNQSARTRAFNVSIAEGNHALKVEYYENKGKAVARLDINPLSVSTPQPTVTQTNTPAPTVFRTATPAPTIVKTGTPVPTAVRTNSPVPDGTPTPIVDTTAVTLAEDANFTQNVRQLNWTADPMFTSYTFSNSSAGVKTLYAKFTASNGQSQVYSSSINLISTATAAPTTVTNAGSGHSYGLWNPSKWDTCTKADHDSFSVIGPDGKRYPTWHPPVMRRADGSSCTFGHDHGRNPVGYQYWDEVRKHFAYDANKNGTIDSAELATAGIPFGYVNEQIDTSVYGFMRHEDHVGHKIEFANGEGDIGSGTDPFNTSMTGGVIVPEKSSTPGVKWDPSGIACYHFQKIHQGVSTPDALTNNLHEVIMHAKCNSTRPEYPSSTSLLSGMVKFGAAGEYTLFCGGGSRDEPVVLGTTDLNKNFPGTRNDGMRNIINKQCTLDSMLVSPGGWSGFPYEIWGGGLDMKNAAGTVIASNGGAWEVLDAIRYHDPDSANKIGYLADVCYMSIGDRKTRGGACDIMTNYGTLQGVTWDDPRSSFRGINRGQYINPPSINNVNGTEVFYTDVFGDNAQSSPFPGSVKQFASKVKTTIDFAIDPRIVQRIHDDGGKTVHAPN